MPVDFNLTFNPNKRTVTIQVRGLREDCADAGEAAGAGDWWDGGVYRYRLITLTTRQSDQSSTMLRR